MTPRIRYLGQYAEADLGIAPRDLLAMGRADPHDSAETFNMAYLALRGSAAVNGVSRLHGSVSRRLFQKIFPRWPETDVPVGHVTNGVHVPTWDSRQADELWTCCCGSGRWRGPLDSVEQDFRHRVSDQDLWALRTSARQDLIDFVTERLAHEPDVVPRAGNDGALAHHVLDPHALTLGFARRFATYKRPNLLLHDPRRLLRLLTDPNRPMQLIIAGKAHPADEPGKELLKAWVQFTRRPEVRGRVVFVPDYDLLLAEHLVRGVDVWINTPRRPWEASGTSGMKVLVNGGLNLSELDGWWAEAYAPEVGWALGDGREHDDPAWDAVEADALYALLEQEIGPAFYVRDAQGIPSAWVVKIRESMSRLTPRFSANRVVREYTNSYYVPAAAAYRKRATQGGASGAALLDWRRHLAQHWGEARFGSVHADAQGDRHEFRVEVWLGGLSEKAIRVELYADATDEAEPVRIRMIRGGTLDGGAYEYHVAAPASRPASDYTPRLIPDHPDAAVPLEASEILWQR